MSERSVTGSHTDKSCEGLPEARRAGLPLLARPCSPQGSCLVWLTTVSTLVRDHPVRDEDQRRTREASIGLGTYPTFATILMGGHSPGRFLARRCLGPASRGTCPARRVRTGAAHPEPASRRTRPRLIGRADRLDVFAWVGCRIPRSTMLTRSSTRGEIGRRTSEEGTGRFESTSSQTVRSIGGFSPRVHSARTGAGLTSVCERAGSSGFAGVTLIVSIMAVSAPRACMAGRRTTPPIACFVHSCAVRESWSRPVGMRQWILW